MADVLFFFGRSCYEVPWPIRLAKVLLAWTIAQEGWGSSSERQIGKCQFAMRTQHAGYPDPHRHLPFHAAATSETYTQENDP
jgi:hypothetical protein